MKLVVAFVHPKDADGCTSALTGEGFICTRINSQGGFLDRDHVTLLVGTDDTNVDQVLGILKGSARIRHEKVENESSVAASGATVMPISFDVEVGGATVFVVDVDRFERL